MLNMKMTTEQRLALIIDLATKEHPKSPGCSIDQLGIGFYQNDGHFVLFHRGDKRAVVHAKNLNAHLKQYRSLIEEVMRRTNAQEAAPIKGGAR